MNKTIIDELCQCGHSKKCHGKHELDNHGANCNQCDCTIYTWKEFVFLEENSSKTVEVKE